MSLKKRRKRRRNEKLPSAKTMKLDPVLHAPIINLLRRGTAKILFENRDNIVLFDPKAKAIFCTGKNHVKVASVVMENLHLSQMVVALDEKCASTLKHTVPGFSSLGPCYQFVWPGGGVIPKRTLKIAPARPDDFEWIRSIYKLTSDQEIKDAITDGNLFIARTGDEKAGIVGVHSEASMGFLEILPQYKRRGYGQNLESFIANHMVQQGMIPYCHVFSDNKASIALQRKMGLIESPEKIEWLMLKTKD